MDRPCRFVDAAIAGCGLCVWNCPYGNIFTETNARNLVQAGDPEDPPVPRCVYACPHDATHRIAGDEPVQRVNALATDLG